MHNEQGNELVALTSSASSLSLGNSRNTPRTPTSPHSSRANAENNGDDNETRYVTETKYHKAVRRCEHLEKRYDKLYKAMEYKITFSEKKDIVSGKSCIISETTRKTTRNIRELLVQKDLGKEQLKEYTNEIEQHNSEQRRSVSVRARRANAAAAATVDAKLNSGQIVPVRKLILVAEGDWEEQRFLYVNQVIPGGVNEFKSLVFVTFEQFEIVAYVVDRRNKLFKNKVIYTLERDKAKQLQDVDGNGTWKKNETELRVEAEFFLFDNDGNRVLDAEQKLFNVEAERIKAGLTIELIVNHVCIPKDLPPSLSRSKTMYKLDDVRGIKELSDMIKVPGSSYSQMKECVRAYIKDTVEKHAFLVRVDKDIARRFLESHPDVNRTLFLST